MKSELRYTTLREAMEAVQNERQDEVGRHTWTTMVERYGLAILFAEVASIVGRLEPLIWDNNPYKNPFEDHDRILDLLIDLGNYTEFLYLSVQKQEDLFEKLTPTKGRHQKEPV